MKQPSTGPALRAAIDRFSKDRLGDPRGFDAIVVGAGAAGGMAALKLTQAGLTVLLLDAGWRAPFWQAPARHATARVVESIANPRLQQILPQKVVDLGRRSLRLAGKFHQPIQTRCFAWELAPEAFVSDRERPYVNEPGSQFDWFRAQQIGGRMVIPGHGRQYYRLSARDFQPTDDLSPRWPLQDGELDAWYEAVEQQLGLSGGSETCAWAPAGPMSKVLSPTPAEAQAIDQIRRRWPSSEPILGRSAPPLDAVERAAATGRLSCRQGAIVSDVTIDPGGRVAGVNWFDRASGGRQSAKAPLVFLCASSLETTRILLSSQSSAAAGAIGRRSDALGRYLMDHVIVSGEGSGGALPGEPVDAEPGRCLYLPRFDLRDGQAGGARGFGIQIYQWSLGSHRSYFNGVSFGEMTPHRDNRVVLDASRRDAWGLPVLRIACRHSERELQAARDQSAALKAVAEVLDVKFHRLLTSAAAPGSAMHECGTARMGDSPENSVLDPHNQCWDAKGLYVTDASCFPSQGAQNPTLTILALTARACAHALSSNEG